VNIAVLVKQVPDLVEELEVASDGKSLDPAALKWKLNEFDDHALEEALLLKEGAGAEVTAIAASGEEADKILYTALAKGATRAWKIAGVDEAGGNLALAKAVAAVLRQKPHDLILTGVQAADDRDGQLGPMVAALLGLPSVEVVTGITLAAGRATLHKEYAGGVMAELEVDLPAVLGVQAARQPPRYAPVSKVKQVQQSARIDTMAAGAEAAAAGFSVVEMTPPERGKGAEMLDSVDELVKVLESKGVI
jgi:electron transfer flavoprotein beta subunit